MRLALVVALLLAGCTDVDAPKPEDERREIPRDEGARPDAPDLCGSVTLDVRPPVVAVGDPVDVTASLANCGAGTLMVEPGLCPDEGSGFRLLLDRGLNEWHLHARADPTAAALRDTPCVRGDPAPFGLPPQRGDVPFVHTVTFRWNGTFATDPCWPRPSVLQSGCLQFAPALPGDHDLRARITAGGEEWAGNATLRIEGAPAQAEPCGRVGVAVDGDVILVSAENCGYVDLTLDGRAVCNEPFPLGARIVGEHANWTLQPAGAAVEDTACYARPMDDVVILAGTTARVRLAWNGTVREAGCASCTFPAAPGAYEVVATLTPNEGGVFVGRTALELRGPA